MLQFLAAALPAVASVVGDLFGMKGQQDTNAANAAQAQKQMDFQERMRSTQYQTAVDDMRKAGLNPALAYQNGGAGTPTGASARMENPMGNAGRMASNAADAVMSAASIQQIKANTAQTEANTRATELDNRAKEIDLAAKSYSGDSSEAAGQPPVMNRYQAALIAKWEQQALGYKYDAETYAKRVDQITANLNATRTNAAQAQANTDLLRSDLPEHQAWGNYYKGIGRYEPYVNGAHDVVRLGKDAVEIFKPGGALRAGRGESSNTLEEHGFNGENWWKRTTTTRRHD